MKTTEFYLVAFFCLTLITSCSNDDTPAPVLEEELITDVILTFTNTANANDTVVLVNNAPDGQDGAFTNTKGTEGGTFTAGATYSLSVAVENDGEDVLDEDIIPEADEHFFVYAVSGIELTMTRDASDIAGAEGEKIGLSTTWVAGNVSTGNIQIKLIHEPTSADASNGFGSAEGEEDFNITFEDIKIQ